ncbi:chaperone [Lithospermum erythrorhizon]|uniref:Chaperone n=1 Tax=Lithospermum erythrorhizon TaxID=34254 RepID=A0AAV3PQA7_LITER
MGSRKKKYREEDDTSTGSSPSYSSSDSDSEEVDIRRRKKRHSSDDKKRRREKDKKRHKRRKEKRRHKRSSSRKKPKRYSDSDSCSDREPGESGLGHEKPEEVVKSLLEEFPGVAGDLEQLLQMIDDGQAVDIKGLAEKSLVNHLKKLFISLSLKESGDKVFLLPPKVHPTLEVVLPIIQVHKQSQKQEFDPAPENNEQSPSPDLVDKQEGDGAGINNVKVEVQGPRRKVIGPEMPSAELLAAAARLTEAEAEMREAELGDYDQAFVGPPPPAVVNEVQSANEAERFEEVARIIGAAVDSPYDILGVNHNMSDDNMKKRYWKLSLMVHPDKCAHPQAHQAFIKLNKAYKDLQDTDKRKALDDKINLKKQEEERMADLKVMREAAQWRHLQGISMEGDDILLAEMKTDIGPKRDEWMTSLPPERKPGGMPRHSTTFNRNSKEGRGDTSVWTDTPIERAHKARMNYLEAYNEATALASNVEDKNKANSEAALVDQYNKVKRSKTLVEQHRESTRGRDRSKKKSKKEPKKEEWEDDHPWKPWDREKDLAAGRQSVKLDPASMTQGLTSRFASGSYQRSFL